ncbi:MAG: class I SAM-dependent methyltransferase [Planctomycetaceae bacterium]|nr:class I SAM-dependent methyltransferase [Planctomycetaceae bacterium]
MTKRAQLSTDCLNGVCETLLIPLAARVVESQSTNPAFRDERGVELAQLLDFDPHEVARDRWNKVGCQARTLIFDDAVNDFLSRHPRALVLNLGAGLCTRFWRVEPQESLRWFDIDLPSVIALKRELLANFDDASNSHKQHTTLDADVTNPSWLEQIPRVADEQVLVIAEGLLMYLDQDSVQRLLQTLVKEFTGGELIIEAWSTFVRRVWGTLSPALRRTGASLHWGLDNPKTIEAWDPRITVKNEWRPGDWEPQRWGLLRYAPALRRSLTKVVHFQLGETVTSETRQHSAA